MRNYLFPVVAAGLFLSQGRVSHAAVITFAQVNLPSTSTFTLTPAFDGGTPPMYVSSTFTGFDNSSATFFFSNTSGTPPTLMATPFGASNPIQANFTLSAFTTQTANTSGFTGANQEFDTQTFSITARGNQTINGIFVANGANLLTETINTFGSPIPQAGQLGGTVNTSGATFGGGDVTTGSPLFFSNITYTSSFINFSGAVNKAFGFGLSSVTPPYTLGSDAFGNQYINAFTAAGVGTFNAAFVPEPGTVALLAGLGVGGSLLQLRRRRARK